MKVKKTKISTLRFVGYSVKEKKYLPIKKIERECVERSGSYFTGGITAVLVNDEPLLFEDEISFLQCTKESGEVLGVNETAFEANIDCGTI